MNCMLRALIKSRRGIKFELMRFNRNMEAMMATLEEIQASQAVTDTKIAAVAADVTALLEKIASIPPAGLTPEQQAAIDDIAAHASKINDGLSGIDASANA